MGTKGHTAQGEPGIHSEIPSLSIFQSTPESFYGGAMHESASDFADADTAGARELSEFGYTVLHNVVDPDALAELTGRVDRRLAAISASHLGRFRHHGSMLPLTYKDPEVTSVLSSGALVEGLNNLRLGDVRWLSGYVISKPPQGPGLWWHQDWWAWEDPITVRRKAPQLFAILYLQKTDKDNGCLRVIPGSHCCPHPLMAELPEPHSDAIELAPDSGVAHADVPEEVAVCTGPGDLVVGDVRLLHSTHRNSSESPRHAVDMVFLPYFKQLPVRLKNHLVQHPALPEVGWWHQENTDVPASLRAWLPTVDPYEPDKYPVNFMRLPR